MNEFVASDGKCFPQWTFPFPGCNCCCCGCCQLSTWYIKHFLNYLYKDIISWHRGNLLSVRGCGLRCWGPLRQASMFTIGRQWDQPPSRITLSFTGTWILCKCHFTKCMLENIFKYNIIMKSPCIFEESSSNLECLNERTSMFVQLMRRLDISCSKIRV